MKRWRRRTMVAAAACVLTLAAYVASGAFTVICGAFGWGVGLGSGVVAVFQTSVRGCSLFGPLNHLPYFTFLPWVGWKYFFDLTIPLWIPLTLFAAVAWRLRIGDRRIRIPGVCQSCNYDLTGITGACPECGAAR
jgi:hypothetical protein